MANDVQAPPTPNPPPAPDVDQLGAGGQPQVAPPAPSTTPQDVAIQQQNAAAAAISPAIAISTSAEKTPDLSTKEGRAEQYLKNRQTQESGESEYDEWLYKNHPEEYRQAAPVHFLTRKLTDKISEKLSPKSDPKEIRARMAPLVHQFVADQVAAVPVPGDTGGVGPTKEAMAAIPVGPEGVSFKELGGVERRAPDSFGRTPGTVMKSVTDASYEATRQHGLVPEEPKGQFAELGGVERMESKHNPQQNVIDDVAKQDQSKATALLSVRDGNVRIRDLASSEPNQGHASKLLSAITDSADTHGVKLELTSSPYGDEKTRLDHDQLKSFYQRHGFVDEPGYDSALGYMIREPKPADIPNQIESTLARTAPAYNQNPAVGFINPDGKFEKFNGKRGKNFGDEATHEDFAANRDTNVSSMIADGWVRKAGQGSYQVRELTPQTTRAIENDILLDSADLKHGNEYRQPVHSIVIDTAKGDFEIPVADFVEKYNGDLGKALRRAAPISNTVESTTMHPAAQQLREKYPTEGVTDSITQEPSFIYPDGQVSYIGQQTHAGAIDSVPAGKQFGGTEEGRTNFVNDAKAIRVRPDMDNRAGMTYHVIVPKDGVTPEQVDALKQMQAKARYGNVIIETADKPSLSKNNMATPGEWQMKSANDIEPILAKLGVLPGQTVNLADTYGDTGQYLGGHVKYQAGKDFPSNFEQDNFNSLEAFGPRGHFRRTTGNNMFDPEGFITGDEMQKGMTYGNSHRNWANEEAYQDAVHGRTAAADVAKSAPRVFDADAVRRRTTPADVGVTTGSEPMEIPQYLIGKGVTTVHVIAHEFGHAVVAEIEGLPVADVGIGSHLHPKGNSGTAAFMTMDFEKLPGASKLSNGHVRIPSAALKALIPKMFNLYMAGGATEEAMGGVTMLKNPGMSGDYSAARRMGAMAGMSLYKINLELSKARGRALDMVTNSKVLDIIKKAASTREEGLSRTLHASPEKVRDVLKQVKEAQNDITGDRKVGDAGRTGEPTVGGVSKTDTRGTEAVSGGSASGDIQGKLFSRKSDPDEVAKKIVGLHEANGGSTFNVAKNEDMADSGLYAVGTHPDRTETVPELTPKVVKAFAKKNADILSDPNKSLGTWNDNGKHVLDVVSTTPDRETAMQLSRDNKQDAIAHLIGKGVVIPTEPEKTPNGSISESQRAATPESSLTGTLPETYLAKVAEIRKTHGDDAAFNEVAQHLPPEQVKKIGTTLKKNLLDALAELPPEIEQDATEAAKAGAIQKGWYQHTATLLKAIFGGESKLISNIIAATSPMNGVRESLIMALNFYADWNEAGRPLQGRDLNNLTTNKFMATHALNLIRAVRGEPISGPKVTQFAKNVQGALDAITNDRWIQFFNGNPKAWSKAKMAASDVVLRRVAKSLGWKPAEVQETIWSFVKPVVELAEKEGVSPSERAKTLTDTEIREGAPSFANLLKDPAVRDVFARIAKATGDQRFEPGRIESSPVYKRVQKATPTPTGKPVGGSADVLGRIGERTAATRTKHLNKGIEKLGEPREPGEE